MNERKRTYSISAARWELSEILDCVQYENEHVILTRNNVAVAVVVPVSDAMKLDKEKPLQSREVRDN